MKKLLLSLFSILVVSLIGKSQNIELWGTTWHGGINENGTIFKLNINGTGFTTVYTCGATG